MPSRKSTAIKSLDIVRAEVGPVSKSDVQKRALGHGDHRVQCEIREWGVPGHITQLRSRITKSFMS